MSEQPIQKQQSSASDTAVGWTFLLLIVVVIGFIGKSCGSDSPSSSSSSYSTMITCNWCGKEFKKGTGYNTVMGQINTPEIRYSNYCSRKCAREFIVSR
jgi:ribosomal protein L24E